MTTANINRSFARSPIHFYDKLKAQETPTLSETFSAKQAEKNVAAAVSMLGLMAPISCSKTEWILRFTIKPQAQSTFYFISQTIYNR